MTITEALKKLIKTITGKNAVGETIEELVTNLNDNYPEGGSGGGDGSITVDSALDADSENPVQNKVITAALGNAGIDYKVSVTVTIDEQTQQPTFAVNKSVKEICEAAVLDKHCWASIVINGVITAYQRMELTEAAAAAGTYGVTFGGVQNDDGAGKPVVLIGENTNYGKKESDIWTPG